ncbi:putative pentatricopeptide repeat-containing protein At3g15130 [Macadamia integrifolia]|uniref:putative pentatricopeptide repeat-containing protein At3g15130 n=1 Tax=Macadamia integrifolia TaxID=60698 RepID=UPI001C4EC5EF|nr:putative pentatricopeptide repeat-containing protein At3g15130 [Macadamia integrifolia]
MRCFSMSPTMVECALQKLRNAKSCSFKAISSLTTLSDKNPIEELEIQYENSINLRHLSHVLDDCTSTYDFRMGMCVHTQLLKFHYCGFISLWNKLLSLYSRSGKIRCSCQLFETMPERDIVSFNTVISAYLSHDLNMVKILHLFFKMQEEDVKPNHITFSMLIRTCVRFANSLLIELLHAQAIGYGLSSNEFVGSSLVDGYAKQKRLEDGVRAFDEIAVLDLVSWNIMIDACISNNGQGHALRIFSRMQQEGVGFDGYTLTSITKACSEPGDLYLGLQLHGCMIKSGFVSETPVTNTLITMYSKCEEGMVSATQIFGTALAPNIISWTAILAGFMQNGQNEEAVGFYKRMLRVGMKENEFSFASILPVYSSLASLEQGRQIHTRIIKSHCGFDVSVQNALLDMYSKCASLADAQLVFMTMENHDVVSYTVMITGFGQHGKGREALSILEAMTIKGLKPDSVTLLGCLSACSHGGLVDEGLLVFKSMIDVHCVKPRMEHYACVVDILGRAGRLKEAEAFIENMEIKSDALVWEALLGACRIHGETELGEKSAAKIMELEPQSHRPYVLLANIYGDKGLWEDKGKVRQKLGASGLRKDAGRSWVAFQDTL